MTIFSFTHILPPSIDTVASTRARSPSNEDPRHQLRYVRHRPDVAVPADKEQQSFSMEVQAEQEQELQPEVEVKDKARWWNGLLAFGGLGLKWETLPPISLAEALPITLHPPPPPALRGRYVYRGGRGVGFVRRPEPGLAAVGVEASVPVVYESQRPASMAKLIMSRHVRRLLASSPLILHSLPRLFASIAAPPYRVLFPSLYRPSIPSAITQSPSGHSPHPLHSCSVDFALIISAYQPSAARSIPLRPHSHRFRIWTRAGAAHLVSSLPRLRPWALLRLLSPIPSSTYLTISPRRTGTSLMMMDVAMNIQYLPPSTAYQFLIDIVPRSIPLRPYSSSWSPPSFPVSSPVMLPFPSLPPPFHPTQTLTPLLTDLPPPRPALSPTIIFLEHNNTPTRTVKDRRTSPCALALAVEEPSRSRSRSRSPSPPPASMAGCVWVGTERRR
ncbi:hypothetical protein C8F01DRAFT_1301587 [Mycena amicta]|nr:hypothetical protein C8F01DRAFT_1301587 [Mycena amicta]